MPFFGDDHEARAGGALGPSICTRTSFGATPRNSRQASPAFLPSAISIRTRKLNADPVGFHEAALMAQAAVQNRLPRKNS
jgi:hypothetical protein